MKTADVMERFFWEMPDDVLALTNARTREFPRLIPEGIASLEGQGVDSLQGVMMKIRDDSGRVIGFGTELEILPLADGEDQVLEVYFTIVLPDRGTLFVHELKRYNDPRMVDIFTRVAATREPWVGELPIVSTAGPSADGLGVILGGTGCYEGATGAMSQTMNFRSVGVDGPRVSVCETFHVTRTLTSSSERGGR